MADLTRSIFHGMQIFMEKKWVTDRAVIAEDGRITAIIPTDMIKHHLPAKEHVFPSDHYLLPGLIDMHIHGAHGKDVMDGSTEALHTISRSLAAEGVTGYLATTMTADNDRIEQVLKTIPEAMQNKTGAAILGVHLEGPFIAQSKHGAQAYKDIRLPDSTLMRHWQDVAQGNIKVVTLAPELPGALPFIKRLKEMDIIASIGHTDASYEDTCAAIAAGCTEATHLFNAMSDFHQREPGAVCALLLASEVNVELIVDGFHLHPAVVDLCLRLKGHSRVLLVTDAMRAKCMGNGQYELGGQRVDVKEGKATLSDGRLAGSTLRMPAAIKNMMQFTGCTLADAISMATENPARMLKLEDRKGRIAVGNDADLVVMNPALEVVLTVREGSTIFTQ